MNLRRFLSNLFKHRHHWKIVRTIWPYADGYGTYCPGCGMIVDTGLPKWQAQCRADKMNGKKAKVRK